MTTGQTATDAILNPADFAYLRQVVRDRSAIVLDESKDYLVENRLRPIMREHKVDSLRGVVERMRREPHGALASAVIDAMTTNETSWFRDIHPFNSLPDVVGEILTTKPAGAPLTVWCAASSSGQEPYTIAMVINEKYPELAAGRRLRIVATDLSPTMVQRTKSGRYTQFEVNRGLPARYLVRYFQQDGKDWVISREIRNLVEARELNLVESWGGLPRCDLVMIRNVLIYFSVDTKRSILGRIRKDVLAPGGFLFLGASETTLNVDDAYVRRDFGKSICYQAPGAPNR
jgi:chemotaxis protein methyltransferase CheR